MDGKVKVITQLFEEILPSSVKGYVAIKSVIDTAAQKQGVFLSLQLLNLQQKVISDNLYWLPDAQGVYSGLQTIAKSQLIVSAKQLSIGKVQVVLSNPAGAPVAFFNRLSLVNAQTHKRLLPVFYSDNYVSVSPGEQKVITIDYNENQYKTLPLLSISGWNFKEQMLEIK